MVISYPHAVLTSCFSVVCLMTLFDKCLQGETLEPEDSTGSGVYRDTQSCSLCHSARFLSRFPKKMLPPKSQKRRWKKKKNALVEVNRITFDPAVLGTIRTAKEFNRGFRYLHWGTSSRWTSGCVSVGRRPISVAVNPFPDERTTAERTVHFHVCCGSRCRDANSTRMRFPTADTLDGYCSSLENPCLPMSVAVTRSMTTSRTQQL